MQAPASAEGAETAACRRYAVAVTGDHSTPAVYGDHSHEPVPFAIAHVRHAVRHGIYLRPRLSPLLEPTSSGIPGSLRASVDTSSGRIKWKQMRAYVTAGNSQYARSPIAQAL